MNETSLLNIIPSDKEAVGRTSPIYVNDKSRLSLNDILNEKPLNQEGQIHISWLEETLMAKILELKYSSWDAFIFPKGSWSSSVYGEGTTAVAGIEGKIAVSSNGSNWEEISAVQNITCMAYGVKDDIKRFICLTSDGKCIYSDDFCKSWNELSVPDESYVSVFYAGNKFITAVSSGKILVSFDLGLSWQVESSLDIQIRNMAFDGNSSVVLTGVDSNGLITSMYSEDLCKTFTSIEIVQNDWSSVVYGDGKFIAVSLDGENRVGYLNKLSDIKVWEYINVPKYSYRSISYGSGIFCAVSLEGKIISSKGGKRWVEMVCPYGEWNNILRTEHFFLVFSTSENSEGLNGMRSSNGGFTNINFATLNELISNEYVMKAVSPNLLKEYIKYITGKNKGQYPVYEEGKFIDCISDSSRQIEWVVIDEESSITDFDKIIVSGKYLILKSLINKPLNIDTLYMLEVDSLEYGGVKTVNQKLYGSSRFVFYTRSLQGDLWSNWEENKINQADINGINLSSDNISISGTNVYSAVNSLVVTDNSNTVGRLDKGIFTENIKQEVTSNLDTRYAFKNHNHTSSEVTGLGLLSSKDKVNLSSDTEGILSVEKGGTGNNLNRSNSLLVADKVLWKTDTSKNLFRYEQSNVVDFDIPVSNCYVLRLGNSNNRGYAFASEWSGSGSRLYVSNLHDDKSSANWTDWKKVALYDESVPNIYTTSYGTWVETVLSTGGMILEGWGEYSNSNINVPTGYEQAYRINIPKNCKNVTITATYSFYDDLNTIISASIRFVKGSNYVYAYVRCNSTSTAVKMDLSWYLKGLL